MKNHRYVQKFLSPITCVRFSCLSNKFCSLRSSSLSLPLQLKWCWRINWWKALEQVQKQRGSRQYHTTHVHEILEHSQSYWAVNNKLAKITNALGLLFTTSVFRNYKRITKKGFCSYAFWIPSSPKVLHIHLRLEIIEKLQQSFLVPMCILRHDYVNFDIRNSRVLCAI